MDSMSRHLALVPVEKRIRTGTQACLYPLGDAPMLHHGLFAVPGGPSGDGLGWPEVGLHRKARWIGSKSSMPPFLIPWCTDLGCLYEAYMKGLNKVQSQGFHYRALSLQGWSTGTPRQA
ncbi:hypothetical protein ISCGN_001259 [Ixodes scapularis]